MASPKLTDAEALAIVEKQRQERLQSTKDFFIGIAKAATTDLPGFLMDVADKAIDPKNVSFGEFDRSSELFEKLTGIKSSGSVSEFLGSLVSPAGAVGAAKVLGAGVAKAMIIPARLGPAVAAKNMEAVGKSADEIYQATKIYRDPVTNSLKEVIPDTGAAFKPGAIDITQGYINPFDDSYNPSRAGELNQDIFTAKRLDEILSHPQMANIPGDIGSTSVRKLFSSGNLLGSYSPSEDVIRLAENRDPDKILSTLLHETQHVLQDRLGMPVGGNPDMFFEYPAFFDKAKADASKLSLQLKNEFDKVFTDTKGLEDLRLPSVSLSNLKREAAKEGFIGERARQKLAKIPVKTLNAHAQVEEADAAYRVLNKTADTAYQNYKNILGEAEARLVQTQHRLDDYTTHPLKLMADELKVNVDELSKVLIKDPANVPKLDKTPEVDDAIEFVRKLMQARAAANKTTP